MKKIFVIIASVVMSLVVIMVIVMSLVKVNVKIDYDGDPKQIYIYNQSTDAISHTSGGSKINYFTKENEEYSEILSYLNKATNISVFERLLNNSTLKNEVEQDFDGTYTKWSTELKKKNIVILMSLVLSVGYLISEEPLSKSELCLVNDNYNPNWADDYDKLSKEGKLAWGTMETVIGFGIGIINPIAGVAYTL